MLLRDILVANLEQMGVGLSRFLWIFGSIPVANQRSITKPRTVALLQFHCDRLITGRYVPCSVVR